MATFVECSYCHNRFPLGSERCPHCAQPGLFPNVQAAGSAEERNALNLRYQTAINGATSQGADEAIKDFEAAVTGSQAVIARSLNDLLRMATSDKEIYATYHQVVDAGLRLPSDEKGDILRVQTDDALFSGYKQHIRFAALSLDRIGLRNYGEFSLVLRENMIAHRASVFEENSVVWMRKHRIKISEANNLPKGYRAIWSDRGKLAVAKLSKKIQSTTQPHSYPGLLLQQGATSEDDQFIEVHIWGPMTRRTFERVIVKQPQRQVDIIKLNALREMLGDAGVTIEEKS